MIDKCGTYLGEGLRRIVYQHKDNPDLVIKFLKRLEDPHNKIEYWNWIESIGTEREKWLTPCISISDDGRFLVQIHVELIEDIPENVPEWLKVLRDYEVGGNKSKAWGTHNNHPVIVDYGDQIL